MKTIKRFVGLDVHKDTIAIAVADQGRDGEVRVYGTISSDLHALDRAVAKLRAGGAELHVAVEPSAPAGRQGADQLPLGDRVHPHALRPHEPEDGEVGAGLLGEPDHVEGAQLADPFPDERGVIEPEGRAVLLGQAGEGQPAATGRPLLGRGPRPNP